MAIRQLTFLNDREPQADADFLNSVVQEINNAIRPFVNILLDDENTQLFETLLKIVLGKLVCKLDASSTGTQYNLVFNATAINSLPQFINYFDGMTLFIINTIKNTGPAKLNLLSKGSKNIYRSDGSLLQEGDLKEGLLILIYNESLDGFVKYNIV